MVIECCSQERTYSKFYGLIGERFAKLNRLWADLFEAAFAKYYDTIHRYETNRLRNIGRFFGHMLGSGGTGWHVLSVVHLNEEETTSSSRIFIKILFQDLAESLGMPKLKERLKDDILRPSFEGLFPKDNARNTRFSINYFTSIGMGELTEDMREHLKNLPKAVMPALPRTSAAPAARSESGADDDDDDGSSVSTYSSYTASTRSSRSPSRSPARRHRRYSRSRSPRRSEARVNDRGRARDRNRSAGSDGSYSGSSRSRSPLRRKAPRGRSTSVTSRSVSSYSSRSRSVTPPRRRHRTLSNEPPRRGQLPGYRDRYEKNDRDGRRREDHRGSRYS